MQPFFFRDLVAARFDAYRETFVQNPTETALCIAIWNFLENDLVDPTPKNPITSFFFLQQIKIAFHHAIFNVMSQHSIYSNQALRFALENVAQYIFCLNNAAGVTKLMAKFKEGEIKAFNRALKKASYEYLDKYHSSWSGKILQLKKYANSTGAHGNFSICSLNTLIPEDRGSLCLIQNFFEDLSSSQIHIQLLIIADVMLFVCRVSVESTQIKTYQDARSKLVVFESRYHSLKNEHNDAASS